VRSLILLAALVVPLAVTPARADPAPQAHQVLFERDTNGFDCYRIPAVVRTKQGTLLAFAEARRDNGLSWCNDAGHIDLVVRRSADNGATWGPEITVASGGPATRGNPVPIVVDGGPHDGRIVLLTTHNPFGQSTPRTPYVQYSTKAQDGTAWTAPRSLADEIDKPDWTWYATGPVHGIQLARGTHAGRLVAGMNADTPSGTIAGIVYSDDYGDTWHLGGTRPGASASIIPQELSPIELTDGRVYLAARNQATGAQWPRAYAISADGGQTLTAPFAFVQNLAATPRVQGSTLRLRATDEGDRYNRILFATPNDPVYRKNLTIYSSYDESSTWQGGKQITTDRSGYSDLVEIGDGRIGVLYEAGLESGDARDEIRFTTLTEADLGHPDGSTSGPKTPDESGRDLDAYVRGGAGVVAGRFGNAIDLTGGYVQAPYALSLAIGSGDFTVSAWIRYGATKGDQAIFWAYGQGETAPQVWLRAEPGAARIRGLITTSAGTASVASTQAYDNQAWHHVALQRGGGQLRLFVDGAQVSTVAAPAGSISTARPFRMYVGQRLDGLHRFDGQLDEVRLYRRALTATELASVRTGNATPPGAELRLPFETMG
jgi:sialidase-1